MDDEIKKVSETSPLETLLSNKELLARLSEIAKDLRSSVGEAVDSSAPTSTEAPESPPSVVSSSAAEGLSAALSDPALMAKLPEVMAALASASSGAVPAKKAPSDKRTALLLALRPYLSESRCEAIDYITRIGKLGDILKNIK